MVVIAKREKKSSYSLRESPNALPPATCIDEAFETKKENPLKILKKTADEALNSFIIANPVKMKSIKLFAVSFLNCNINRTESRMQSGENV